LPPPWSIKGEASPQPRGERREFKATPCALTLLLSHDIFSHRSRDLEATLPLPPCLYLPHYKHPRCRAI
jgi:hypothetical protein